jgi:hypothetical protein
VIHYVFRQENTYATEFRGKKALGVRDLGKGESADLVIPEQFAPYERVYLRWDLDWERISSNRVDVLINIIGFIPFGILMFWELVKRNAGLSGLSRLSSLSGHEAEKRRVLDKKRLAYMVFLTVVAGFVVSFAIEYLQAYLPSRDSSLRDLVTNVLGTFIGAIVAMYLLKRVGRSGQWTVDSGQ